VHLGIVTPALTLVPRGHAKWEEDNDWGDVVDIVRAADRLGFHHVTCSEHVAVPAADVAVRGGRYWDPLATFGYLAAVTTQIRFVTYVLVLGYHHPLEIAKRYGTLDRVSGGRLVLGVGVGTLQPEFELLGAPFADRGARADDALRALRASFGVEQPTYEGEHYRFDGLVVDPHGVQRDVPIWIGGRSARSLRRAVELADGWAPFWLGLDEVRRLLANARDTEAWAARDEPLATVLALPQPIDPVGDADASRRSLDDVRDAGATHAVLSFVHHSPTHYVEQLEAVRELA
jgi:probable F420-dependent oxidoreductase